MTTRNWECACGEVKCEVKGEPKLAVWCHCEMCRKYASCPMELGIFPELNVLQGKDSLLKYESSGGVSRNSCSKCGSFAYKEISDGTMIAPLGAMTNPVKPTCNIFVGDRGEHDIMAPDLPQHDKFP